MSKYEYLHNSSPGTSTSRETTFIHFHTESNAARSCPQLPNIPLCQYLVLMNYFVAGNIVILFWFQIFCEA